MSKNLVIVESPAKAKTIEKFLGKDYQVRSSMGHVRDLPSKGLGIDIENDFNPIYEINSDKTKIVGELKKLSKTAEVVWLATDEDREGEAISWHLKETLSLTDEKIKRIAFHEITKTAVETAIQNPRNINYNLVDAQQARRILDRLVGFELSPVLWKKVKPSLSAGRVQSVAVKLVVEREKEINNFKTISSFKVFGEFEIIDQGKTYLLKSELSEKFATKKEAESFLEKCKDANFVIKSVETTPGKKTPSPPFTTSTLQQEASRKLGFSVSRTMVLAQKLYESGKITYMRTDSVNLSQIAINSSKKEIESRFGKEYSKPRNYQTKTKGAQEAHEAIRPTYISNSEINDDASAKKLYELIWKRTIASQMSEAIIEKTNITISISNAKETFITLGEVIKFDGFLKVYLESRDDENENDEVKGTLPPVKKGDKLNYTEIIAQEKFSLSPPRYTEASLVKKLEDLGIGRPSTYAPTISTIQKRGYVVIEDREGKQREYQILHLKNSKISSSKKIEKYGYEKRKLFPTDIGTIVTNFLSDNFKKIMDYNFTALVEKEFDEIAEGHIKWNKMIKSFYKDFHPQVEQTLLTSERAKGERELGQDPKTGNMVVARLGRYGPMVEIINKDEEQKKQFASLNSNQSIDSITIEEALKLFELPRQLGEFENEEVIVSKGRFGPYIKHKDLFVSLPKNEDIFEIQLQRAIELIIEKQELSKQNAPKMLGKHENEEVQAAVGRFGPYLKIGKKNYSLPKGTNVADLSLEQALKMIAETKTKNVIVEYSEEPDIKILSGKYGAYISFKKENYKIPKEFTPEKLTLKECKEIIDNTPSTKSNKKTTKGAKTNQTKTTIKRKKA